MSGPTQSLPQANPHKYRAPTLGQGGLAASGFSRKGLKSAGGTPSDMRPYEAELFHYGDYPGRIGPLEGASNLARDYSSINVLMDRLRPLLDQIDWWDVPAIDWFDPTNGRAQIPRNMAKRGAWRPPDNIA